ncbi:unnamed protein product, partial [Prunus brigantina]
FGYVGTWTPLTGCYRRHLAGILLCVLVSLVPRVGWLVPSHMVIEDSFVWFSQTIPTLDWFPRYMMCTIICTSPWILILGNSGHGYLDT